METKWYKDPVQKKKRRVESLRSLRRHVCFPVINRGALWYETLTDAQLLELRAWYDAWLNVTETLKIPKKPEWLTEKKEEVS